MLIMAVVTANITHAPTPAHGTDCARQVYARSTVPKSGAPREERYLVAVSTRDKRSSTPRRIMGFVGCIRACRIFVVSNHADRIIPLGWFVILRAIKSGILCRCLAVRNQMSVSSLFSTHGAPTTRLHTW